MESLLKYVQDNFVAKKDFPEFSTGDTITVYYEIKEGDKNLATQSKRPKSADLKKQLLKQINIGLIPYLTSASFVNPQAFTHFADTVAQIINTINAAISGRSKKAND